MLNFYFKHKNTNYPYFAIINMKNFLKRIFCNFGAAALLTWPNNWVNPWRGLPPSQSPPLGFGASCNPFDLLVMTQQLLYKPILVDLQPKLWFIILKHCQHAKLSIQFIYDMSNIKGGPKKPVMFQALICNFLVNRWSEETVLLRT